MLPSGSEPVVQEEILRNDRWRRLASGFHEVGALLLVAAPAAVPGVERLIDMLDGVVLVGGAASPAPNARVFAEVASAARRRRTAAQRAARVAIAPTSAYRGAALDRSRRRSRGHRGGRRGARTRST